MPPPRLWKCLCRIAMRRRGLKVNSSRSWCKGHRPKCSWSCSFFSFETDGDICCFGSYKAPSQRGCLL